MSGAAEPFRARTVALLIGIGVVAFAVLLWLGAYAPDMRSGRNGGAHALSDGATGYSALVALAQATGRGPVVVRDKAAFARDALLIVTPERGASDISPVLTARADKPTLIILPKWRTQADPKHRGWVQRVGLLPLWEPVGVLSPAVRFTMRQYRSGRAALTSHSMPGPFRAPRPMQVITGVQAGDKKARDDWQRLTPLLNDRFGHIVLARIGDRPLYVLSDPDLLNNRGMRDAGQAGQALALLDRLNRAGAGTILFDVSTNGFGKTRSPLKLLFEPPFLVVTLTIVAALLLTGLHALGRFGPVRRSTRAVAFGKAALVDNSALLFRKAGREAALGGRYAEAMRDRAARRFGASAAKQGAALDAWLDGLDPARPFTQRADAMRAADDRASLLHAGQALHDWQEDVNK
ncbi:MAG: hypothetical protein ABW164_05670 [Sphingobium sp.]